MSIFRSIKGTFTSVQKDIANSLKSLKVSDSKKKTKSLVHSWDPDVTPDAGADLLHKYEEAWAEIHTDIVDTSKVAQKIDLDISEMFVFYERQNEALNSFLSELSILPQLTKDINNIVNQIETLEQDFMTIENLLVTLEDVCEQQEIVTNKKKHENQLEIYRQQKNIEVEKAKVELANVHAQKVQVYEAKLQESLREKQMAIEDAYHYEEEIQKYKISGETKLKPQSSTTSSDADLADICVDEDSSALEEFLGQPNEQATIPDESNAKEEEKEVKETSTDDVDENNEDDFKDTEESFVKVAADEDITEEELSSQVQTVPETQTNIANTDSSD